MINDELLHKWINNTISDAELEVFQTRPEYPSLVELYKNTENMDSVDFDQDSVLDNILSSQKNDHLTIIEPNKKAVTLIPNWTKYAIAASILMCVVYFIIPKETNLIQHIAQRDQIQGTLPDESIFVLNAGSELTYTNSNWQENREVMLQGEAFFEVQKGSSFEVNTKNGYVRVLGTRFNVRSILNTLEVICEEGSVEVSTDNGDSGHVLRATEAIKIRSSGEVELWKDVGGSGLSWKNGITKLRDVTLAEVILALENQFDVKISITDISLEERLTCSFQHKDLDSALKTATSPLELKWEINQQKVVLYK